jgi:Na+/proline symporter
MGQVLFNVDQWTIIWVCCIASIVYSALGGFRGAIITDFFLFLIILAGAFAIMYFGWSHPAVGGFSKMMSNPVVQSHLDFFPSFGDTDTLVAVFIIPIAIQWWNVWYPGSEPGGGGYIVHRMLTARNENHCQAGTLLFLVMNYVVRPWPWYLAAFATLIIFPDLESLKATFPHISENMVKGDLAYPALFKFIPNGWLGLVVASMLGALFSTVAAHLSMGSNYIANDVWKRFVRKDAGERELIVVGRLSVVVLMLASAFLTDILASVGAFFNLILQIGAGTGLIFLLRWFWMRINAWSEITAMTVSFVVAVYLQVAHPSMLAWQRLLVVMAITTVAWVAVTLATPPTDAAKRAAFLDKVRPRRRDVGWGLLAMSVGALSVYSLMFGAGCWIYGEFARASVVTAVAACGIAALFPIVRRLNGK